METIDEILQETVNESIKKCRLAGCEETDDVCGGCGYCPEHHYLDTIGRAKNILGVTQKAVSAGLLVGDEFSDDNVLNMFFAKESARAFPGSVEHLACRMWFNGIHDLDTLETAIRSCYEVVGEEEQRDKKQREKNELRHKKIWRW